MGVIVVDQGFGLGFKKTVAGGCLFPSLLGMMDDAHELDDED